MLRRLNTGAEGDGSVEGYINDAVRGMDADKRLDMAIEVLGLGPNGWKITLLGRRGSC